jgi:MoaA/NifB/PqqE/SkfB family radical SAM enzyme
MKDNSRIHYQTFHHIFLYITENCQLKCKHCYMGERLERKLSMSYSQAINYITLFYKIGARDLTILGGEPTIHKDFVKIINYAREIGYQKINVDTNGINISKFTEINPSVLNYIRFSLDGPYSKYHNYIRGKGTFEHTIDNIKKIIDSGFNTAITSIISKHNYEVAKEFLPLADQLGIKLINFHILSEEGYARNINELALTPTEWISFCEYLETVKNNYKTSIWYPPSWCKPSKLEKFINEGYQGCLGISMDRFSIFPDGTCYICSVLFDKNIWFGKIENNKFKVNRNNNEFELFINSIFKSEKPYLSGCPAESKLYRINVKAAEEVISICRCWKTQI